MIPRRIPKSLFLILIFLFILSCQKQERNPKKESVSSEVNRLIELADQYNNTLKTDSAFYYYNKAKSIANPKLDFNKMAYSLLKMAEIQQNHDDYIGSETTAIEAIQYINKTNYVNYTWLAYNILGTNYLNTCNFNNSLYYFKKAYNLNTDKKRRLEILSNIALVYRGQKRHKEAIEILERCITEREIINDSTQLAKTLDNLGYCYALVNNPKAKAFLHKGLDIRLKLKNDLGLALSYIHLAKFYNKSNSVLVKKYAELSYEKYTKVKCIDARINSLALIIKNSNDSELKKNSLIYVALVDSAFEISQRSRNKYAKFKYDSKVEKQENFELRTQKAQSELQIERQKNRNIISYIIIILSISLILVIYYYLTSKGNKEKIEATYKSETRIAKKLHDELANDIYHIMAFAENKNLSAPENKEQLVTNLDAIYSRTRDISKDNCSITSNGNYMLYLKEMISGFNTPGTNLILSGLDTIKWDAIKQNKKNTVYRILQELLVNMRKHSNATLVGINFKVNEKYIIVNYTDNGKGADINKIAFKSGLHNVESRVQNIKGEIQFDSAPGKGFKVYIKFPM